MRKFLYADESGNFDFSRGAGASRYFILTTVAFQAHSLSDQLTELRRELAWQGISLPNGFHATNDSQRVRNAVFEILLDGDFRIDATILEKPKMHPRVRHENYYVYLYVWNRHIRRIASEVAAATDELMVIIAAIRFRGQQKILESAMHDAIGKASPTNRFQSALWPAASDTTLQIADYCSWAIQRKWENGDMRTYNLIKDKIQSETDLYRRRTRVYY